ncbi:hypothetical protein R0J90_21405, partial [Micrococcus sp. SIMBA_144]
GWACGAPGGGVRPWTLEERPLRVIDVGLREGHEYRVRDTWLTVPNLITLARFALVPVFVRLTVDGRHPDAFVILAVLSGR